MRGLAANAPGLSVDAAPKVVRYRAHLAEVRAAFLIAKRGDDLLERKMTVVTWYSDINRPRDRSRALRRLCTARRSTAPNAASGLMAGLRESALTRGPVSGNVRACGRGSRLFVSLCAPRRTPQTEEAESMETS